MKKKYVTCDLGITLREDLAQKVDQITKGLPQTRRKILRKAAVPQTIELEPESRTDVSFVTTECVDRDGEVVLRAGIDKTLFDQNPVVLWMHDSEIPAVGRCLWMKPQGRGVIAKTQYARRPDDYQGDFFPDQIWALVQQEIVKAKSIGFLPLKVRAADQQEIEADPTWQGADIIEESLLLEYSVCNLGVCPEALVIETSKGFTEEFFRKLGVEPARKVSRPVKLRPKRSKAPSMPTVAELVCQELRRCRLCPDEIAKLAWEQLRNRGRV